MLGRFFFTQSAASSALSAKVAIKLQEIESLGLYKVENVLQGPQGTAVEVSPPSSSTIKPVPMLNFCSNNYLGLASHPAIVRGAHDALDRHGFGLASVRFICGTQDIARELEGLIAGFNNTEDAILYGSCFDANAGLFEALLGPEDAIVSDELNHASIIDGIRLCKAKRFRYRHLDVEDLGARLAEARAAVGGKGTILVATDGVFSMDGDVAPLSDICDAADAHGAAVFVDDAHGTGVLGPTGRGTMELTGTMKRVAIVSSTLGKALGGGTGGYTAASAEVIALLRQRSRPYLFSNAVAPPVVGGSIAAIKLLTAADHPCGPSQGMHERLRANTELFRRRIVEIGYKIRAGFHPIVPVMIGDARLAAELASGLRRRGILVVSFSYPVVPKDTARVRVQLSAAHTQEQVEAALAAFETVGKELKIVP